MKKRAPPLQILCRRSCSDRSAFVDGEVAGFPCQILLDTGSPISIVSKRFVKKIGMDNKIVGAKPCVLKGVSGGAVPMESKVLVNVALGNSARKVKVWIAEMEDDVILGMDFLKSQGCVLDLQLGTVKMGSTSLALACNSGKPMLIRAIRPCEAKTVPVELEQLVPTNSGHEEDVKQLLRDFTDVFAVGSKSLGRTDMVRHKIQTEGAAPIKQAPRRMPLAKASEAQKAIQEMVSQGVVKPSQSPWSSPVVLVRKKDGSLRFCVDYRRLNAVTKKDSYPLPRIDDCIDSLAGSRWFSTLDLKSGYWQVEMDPADREKTAFSVGFGLWEFDVMPFGLCNAVATFQRLMERVLVGLQPTACVVYVNDIIVHG